MKMFEGMYRAIFHRSPRTESSVSARVKQIDKANKGNATAAAKAAGVSPRTWRRWIKGEAKPKAENEKKLTAAYRDTLVPKGRRDNVAKSTKELRPGERATGGVTIVGTVTVSSDTRTRRLNLGQHAPDGAMAAIMDAMLAGDDARAQDLVNELVGNYARNMGASIEIDVDSVHIAPVKE